jgi:hypothetical protein
MDANRKEELTESLQRVERAIEVLGVRWASSKSKKERKEISHRLTQLQVEKQAMMRALDRAMGKQKNSRRSPPRQRCKCGHAASKHAPGRKSVCSVCGCARYKPRKLARTSVRAIPTAFETNRRRH